jgi:ribulose-bisphosphate carboxylase small chain
MQAYSPSNGKQYETLSYLPPISNEEISKQIRYMINNNWTPALEFSDDGDIYLNTRMGPGYYDNRYWSMYKLPLFGCKDPDEVVREIDACRKEFPNAKVRVIAFDSKRQVQTTGFVVTK